MLEVRWKLLAVACQEKGALDWCSCDEIWWSCGRLD